MGKLRFVLALVVIATGVQGHGSPRDVTVMTRNLYLGASLDPVLMAGSLPEVAFAVADVWQSVQNTDFPARAVALADEIRATRPDLIGLQEAVLWRVQVPGDGLFGGTEPATEVAYDFVELLLDALKKRGCFYRVVASIEHLDAELPAITGIDVRLTDRDVILARCGTRICRTDAGHFENLISLPVGGAGGPVVTIKRGWVSADVRHRGKQFRFVNTHLEDGFAPIQEAQALELLAGPLDTRMPVICLGDFNSDAIGAGTDSYEILLDAGFEDAWTGSGGATWGHAADLLNPLPNLTERLDLVLFRGRFEVEDVFLVGDDPADRTASGLWPSDHAGVVAMLEIKSRVRRYRRCRR